MEAGFHLRFLGCGHQVRTSSPPGAWGSSNCWPAMLYTPCVRPVSLSPSRNASARLKDGPAPTFPIFHPAASNTTARCQLCRSACIHVQRSVFRVCAVSEPSGACTVFSAADSSSHSGIGAAVSSHRCDAATARLAVAHRAPFQPPGPVRTRRLR
jgi:hypothetical protein